MSQLAAPALTSVIFDIGGVLLDWNPRYLYRKLFDDEQEMEWFLTEVCSPAWHERNDLGVPFAQAAGELAARYPEYSDAIWAWGQRSEEMIAGPISGTVEILRQLRERAVPCYALTNMEAETYPLRLARYDFLQWFQGTVVSSAEGLLKPDPRIFHRLLDRFGLTPQTTLFVDDSRPNVDAALALGMQAMRFRSPEDLRRRLVQAGVLGAGR